MLLIENKNPLETHTNFGPYTHRLELKDDDTGEILGVAELVYINDGIPFYYLFYICIKQEEKGKGYGSLLLNKLNEFLLTRGKAGLLRNIISKDSPTCGIYEKNGWVPVNSKEGWFIFNSPKDLAYASILKAIAHVKTIEEKGVFYLPQ